MPVNPLPEPKQLLDKTDIQRIIKRMVEDLAETVQSPDELALIGIRTHGVTIAQRMHRFLALEYEWEVPLGIIDITLYRDDLDQLDPQPIVRPTRIDFDITNRIVVLIDDVLFTGRTVRCALSEIMDFGRPRAIRLATLVDRGLRELPIQPDITGVTIETSADQKIDVRLDEPGEEDGVWIFRPEGPMP